MIIKELLAAVSSNFEVSVEDFSEDTLLSEFIVDDVDLSILVEAITAETGVVFDDITAESWVTLADILSNDTEDD